MLEKSLPLCLLINSMLTSCSVVALAYSVINLSLISLNNSFQDQSIPYDSKKNVWVPDPEEGFVAGEITATKGDTVTITTAKGNEVAFMRIKNTLSNTRKLRINKRKTDHNNVDIVPNFPKRVTIRSY